MRILIAIIDAAHMEEILSFSQQFINRIDEPPTFLRILETGNHHRKDQKDIIDIELETEKFKKKIHEILKIENFHSRFQIGKPEEEIPNEIHERGYDLLIFDHPGNKKYHIDLKKTKTQRITERVPCSVLIVRGKARLVQRILLCDSGAEESRLVKKFLSQVIEVLGRNEMPTVLHVMSQISAGPGVRGKQLRAEADELIVTHTPEGDLLKHDMETLKEAGLQPAVKIRHGLVVEEILAEAKTGDYDLVVIGSNRERWQHFLLDDLALQIVKRVEQPLLVLK